MAPGLSYDAAKYLGERRVVAAGLDTPFVDPVNEGQLAGTAGPPAGTPEGMPFAVHHHFLTQVGVHTLENLNLKELAQDQVSTSARSSCRFVRRGREVRRSVRSRLVCPGSEEELRKNQSFLEKNAPSA